MNNSKIIRARAGFVLGMAMTAVLLGAAKCDVDNTNRVTGKPGADVANTELCKDPAAPFVMKTKKGTAGEVIVCVSEETFNKYKVGDPYP